MAMILSGEPIPAREALDAGLVDEIVEGDLVAGAIAFARRVVAEKRALVLVRNRDEKLLAARDLATFDAAAANYTKRAKGQNAPAAAVEALRAALTLPVADALTRERELFSNSWPATSPRPSATSSSPSGKPQKCRTSQAPRCTTSSAQP